jgi:hypothetical protein
MSVNVHTYRQKDQTEMSGLFLCLHVHIMYRIMDI